MEMEKTSSDGPAAIKISQILMSREQAGRDITMQRTPNIVVLERETNSARDLFQ